jgi:MFS family permease
MFLFFFRALLGIGMGAEWPAGASLATESWPARSRGLMSSILQGPWALVFLASSAAYGLLYNMIGWRGLLWIGILPALVVVWVRKYVVEPPVWLENRKKQRKQKREVRLPLFAIFKRGRLLNTLTACWWMASGFVVYYSIFALFATHLQKDLALSAALVSVPLMFSNAATFAASFVWGWVADLFGRRWSMIIPAVIALLITPTYLVTNDYATLAIGFSIGPVRRRDLWPEPELPLRALPDRGARDGDRVLLSPGRDFRRSRRTGADLYRHQLQRRLRRRHDDRHHDRAGQLHCLARAGTGDEGPGIRIRRGRRLMRCRVHTEAARTASAASV